MSIKRKSIVTKIGDNGYTYPYSGDKLSKSDLKLEVVGTMDELVSFLGMAKSLIKNKKDKNLVEKIQKNLFVLGSQISGLNSKKLKKRITSKHIAYLEHEIEKLEEKFSFKDFILPGDNLVSSTLHVTRAIIRRLERRTVAFKNKTKFKNKNILIYLNRLSDLLFLLAYKYSLKD